MPRRGDASNGRARARLALTAAVLTISAAVTTTIPVASAAEPGFAVQTVWTGLTAPTNIEFAANGLVFVAQKNGVVKAFDGLNDSTSVVAVDLRRVVFNYWDRGLLGMATDPQFGTPSHNFLYLLYTYDAPPGQVAPVWNDRCPGPPDGPDPMQDGCVVTGMLSRFSVDSQTGVAVGAEQALIGPDWCQQFPSHSIGDLAFDADGALYVTGGDGASFAYTDYGQAGGTVLDPTGEPYTPANPCGDPPNGLGTANTAPTGRGGALRSQSLSRPAGEPVSLDGTVLRVNPATGLGLPSNPRASSDNVNERRVIGYGLRNPFRMTVRPGTNEIWLGDVGNTAWEELNRIASPTAGVRNFGWPCYEGVGRKSGYSQLNQCKALYADTEHPTARPFFTYHHQATVGTADTCRIGSSSTSGLAFYDGDAYPSRYDGALFLADHSRSCIWVMYRGADGLPDPATIETFIDDSADPDPVDLETDPASGDVVFVDFGAGAVKRITFSATNTPPTAVARATTPTDGPVPLTVSFDGTRSSDPDGDALSYAWDLDGDRDYDDASTATARRTYQTAGSYAVSLHVTDARGASARSEDILVTVGNTRPVPVIDSPGSGLRWAVGTTIGFTGHATDAQNGDLEGGALVWTLTQHHCPSDCHAHRIGRVGTGATGSFVAPDHSYPSYLQLTLTATDSGGLKASTSVRLEPRVVDLTFETVPVGLRLDVNGESAVAPFTRTVIVRSRNSLSAPSPQEKNGRTLFFRRWSDAGAASHDIVAPALARTYTARYHV